MNLRDEVEKIKAEGYSEANAESKLCQDIVLKAIAESGMARNATVKGGVVMRSLSKNSDFFELYENHDKVSIGYREHESANPDDMLMYYAKEQIEKHGVMGIELDRLNKER